MKTPILFAAGAILLPGILQAAIVGPYAVDANTLHLWQFNEASGTTVAKAMPSGSFNLTAVNGATLGSASYTGFGNAGYTGGGAALDDAFQGSGIAPSGLTGTDGAFTFEAMLKLANTAGTQEILALDNSSSASARPFQFVIKTGVLTFTNISGGAQNLTATIPTTGADAFDANAWFHVAVTYNGSANTANNLKFYWTKVDPSRTVAAELASLQMTSDLGGNSSTLGVANEFRGPPNENINGYIDEVRISNIARAADQMMFAAVPEPATVALLFGMGALGFVLSRRLSGGRARTAA